MIHETLLLAALLAVAQPDGGTPAAPPAAPEPSVAAADSQKGADMELLEESRRTAQHVERIRALRFAAVPPAVRAGEPARREAAERRVAAADATSSLAARGRAWEDLGLGGPASPRRLLGALALDIQGVALDREGRKVLVDPSFLTAEDFAPKEGEDAGSVLLLATGVRRDEPPLAHVLVHALQRGRTGADPLAGTTDAALAASAWAEGEANLVAIFYLLEGLGLEGQVLEKTLDPGQWLDGALLPASMDVLPGVEAFFMDFVYREGYAQAVGAFRTSGWKGVDRSVAGRRTTRDLLHPDRPPLAVAAIADPPAPNGWILADRDSLGEEGIVALVSILSGKDNLGLMAGDGWAGDALLRFESQAGSASREGLTLWLSRWISPEEAADFEYGVERCLAGRFPGAVLAPSGPQERRMAAGGKSFRLSRNGTEVVLEVAAENADAGSVKPGSRRTPEGQKNSKNK